MCSKLDIGTPLAVVSPCLPQTVADLLTTIDRAENSQSAMLHSVASQFLSYVNANADEVPIQILYEKRDGFIAHLKAGRYKASSVKSYRNYLNILIRRAKDQGWVYPEVTIPSPWRAFAEVISTPPQKDILRFAIRISKVPE